MTPPKPATPRSANATAEVDAFMAALDHPHKAVVELLRRVIREADPAIAEGIKWNAPSFRTREYFATTHLRMKEGIGLILHLGAKAREASGLAVQDPEGLLRWLGKDRAMVVFRSAEDLLARRTPLEHLIRQWIAFL